MADKASKTLEDVQKLVKLAMAEEAPIDERRNSALAAVKLMTASNLTVVSKDELESVRQVVGEARMVARRAKQARTQNMVMGAILGAVVGPKLGIKLG